MKNIKAECPLKRTSEQHSHPADGYCSNGVLTLSTIFSVRLWLILVWTCCVNRLLIVLPARHCIQPPSAGGLKAAADERGPAFIVVFGNLALMTRREKWPLLRLEWLWIMSVLALFRSLEPLGRIKSWQRGKKCGLSSSLTFSLPCALWFICLLFLFTPHSVSFLFTWSAPPH